MLPADLSDKKRVADLANNVLGNARRSALALPIQPSAFILSDIGQ